MSSLPNQQKPVMVGSPIDPARAAAVSDAEYARLLQGMESVLMPLLSTTAAHLSRHGFLITKLERRDGLASLVVRSRRPQGIRGWIYFQIHRSFGPLLSSERVFWMYCVQDTSAPLGGKPGRLKDFADPLAIARLVTEFETLCKAATGVPG